MRKAAFLFVIFGILLVAVGCNSTTDTPRPTAHKVSGVPYPQSFPDAFVHYLTVERIDGTIRDIYINRSALKEVIAGRSLPNDTVILVDGYYAQANDEGEFITDSSGRFVKGESFEMLHVAEKRLDWRDSDFVSNARNGDWNFGSFDPKTGKNFDEDITACFHCHNPAMNTDFIRTYPELLQFVRTGKVQYFYCDLDDRSPCRGV